MTSIRLLRAAAMVLGMSCTAPAVAQLHLPQLPLQAPNVPAAPDLTRTAAPVTSRLDNVLDPRDLLDLRKLTIRNLLRRHRELIEADPAGEPIVRSEVVVLAPPAAALDAARAAGFTVVRESTIEGIDERMVVLRAPLDMTTATALQRLRLLDQQGRYDFNHLYLGAGRMRSAAAVAPRSEAYAPADRAPRPTVGLIDGGLDLRHPALREADIRTYGCSGVQVPNVHGTGVASLLVGRAPGFAGAAPEATLYAADVYCGQPTGGAAALLIEALGWMARERVPVINISLVGPANRTLEHAVRTLIARGHVIVAAVGNEGPAAPPLYPAAYPGVIGVTAVDARQNVLPEALRGPQVVFAAPGVDMATAASGTRGYARARGTSFAAPLVAGLLANAAGNMAASIEPSAAQRAIDELIHRAIDLGPPGRDDIFGFGLLGERLRVDPLTLR